MTMLPARRFAVLMLAAIVLAAVVTTAQTPSTGLMLRFSATIENIAGAPDSIRIDLFRWSTDAERAQLLSAWAMTEPPGRRGRGGGRGAALSIVDPAPDPAAVDDGNTDPFGAFGGRGGRGGPSAGTPPPTPEGSLTLALRQSPTVGYLWSSEVAGYSLRYAGRLAGQDGGERIILITDRRLGATSDFWKLVGPAAIPNSSAINYGFSVIELRLNSKEEGEGKISLTGKVSVDSAAKMVGLENYGALPVVLKNVRRRNPENVSGK